MPKVSIELYVDDIADNCYTAVIPDGELHIIRKQFAITAEELLFTKENDDA